jgi:glycosyltransferase involved in cell wall biosynthesis
MRVTVVCVDPSVVLGGHEEDSRRLTALSDALADGGHHVLVVTASEPVATPRHIDHVLVTQARRSEPEALAKAPIIVDHLADHVRTEVLAFRPDVVHERVTPFTDSGLWIAASVGAAHVAQVDRALAPADASGRRCTRVADLRITADPALVEWIDDVAPGRPSLLVPDAIEPPPPTATKERTAVRQRLGLGETTTAVLVLDRFGGQGRPPYTALHALAEAPSTTLLVLSDGADQGELEALALQLGVSSRIRFLAPAGAVSLTDARAAADAVMDSTPTSLSPTGAPLLLYGHLAAGLPVIASAEGAAPAALGGGRYGTLVRPGDIAGFATGLLSLRSAADRWRSTIAAAQAYVLREQSWAHRAERWTELVSGVLGTRGVDRAHAG